MNMRDLMYLTVLILHGPMAEPTWGGEWKYVIRLSMILSFAIIIMFVQRLAERRP